MCPTCINYLNYLSLTLLFHFLSGADSQEVWELARLHLLWAPLYL